MHSLIPISVKGRIEGDLYEMCRGDDAVSLHPLEEVDAALEKGSCLETICSYCQNKVSLDPRTFEPLH
jgi:hypothetical protein